VSVMSVEAHIAPPGLLIYAQRQPSGARFAPRRLLEPAIPALPARRATPEEVKEMERILDQQAKEIAAGRTGLPQDAEFHAAIASAAHNQAITRLVHGIMDLLGQSREESLNAPGRPMRSHQDHRRVL